MPHPLVDLSRVRTYPLVKRENLVVLQNLIMPDMPAPEFNYAELAEVAARLADARRHGRPVIWMLGGHVVKRGLAPVLIDLMERGLITHLASNGAATIHDFEIALMGQTSEDVLASLADGSFGMAEETGAWMNQAIRSGARDGLGIGESLGRRMAQDERFQYRGASLLYNAFRLGVPYTVHVAIGTDIIHQHPLVDFAALGWASGQDFKAFTAAVCDLEGGVFCNFGSAVIGPEVFLKAVSIARNLGNSLRVFTTANFDLIPLADYRSPLKDNVTDYYYRPRKNIVNRPVALGGKGFHICGDHRVTIPNLHHLVVSLLERAPRPVEAGSATSEDLPEAVQAVFNAAFAQAHELIAWRAPLCQAYHLIERSLSTAGCLWIAAESASHTEAQALQHALTRLPNQALPEAHQSRLADLAGGETLAGALKPGLRVRLLAGYQARDEGDARGIGIRGVGALEMAGAFDIAQELYGQARAGDALLAVSQRDADRSVLNATRVARALGLPVIFITGPAQVDLLGEVDVSLQVNGATAEEIHAHITVLLHILTHSLAGG